MRNTIKPAVAFFMTMLMLLTASPATVLVIAEEPGKLDPQIIYASPSGITFVPAGYTYVYEENGQTYTKVNYQQDMWITATKLTQEQANAISLLTKHEASYSSMEDGSVIKCTNYSSCDSLELYADVMSILTGEKCVSTDTALLTIEPAFQPNETVKIMIQLDGTPVADRAPVTVSNGLSDAATQAMCELKAMQEQFIKVAGSLLGYDVKVSGYYTLFTNSVAIEARYGDITKLNAISGVKRAYVMPAFEIPEINAAIIDNDNPTRMQYAGPTMGANDAWSMGYMGEGMTVAVIDTGISLQNDIFSQVPSNPLLNKFDRESIGAIIEQGLLHSAQKWPEAGADDFYYSDKLPYGYDYGTETLSFGIDNIFSGHGSHVAGIIAGNASELLQQYGVKQLGIAPEAQLINMKVANTSGQIYLDYIIAAVEDALLLGCDMVNVSIASAAGAVYLEGMTEFFDNAADAGVNIVVSAGNDASTGQGSFWGEDYTNADHPSTGTVGMPGSFDSVLTVASAENSHIINFTPTMYVNGLGLSKIFIPNVPIEHNFAALLGDGSEYAWTGSIDDSFGKLVFLPVIGSDMNADADVAAAAEAGAVGIIYYDDDNSYYVQLTVTDYSVPVCWTHGGNLKMNYFFANDDTMISFGELLSESEVAGQLSYTSSYGPTEGLTIKPEITGIGGNVISAYYGTNIAVASGTSMSSPTVAAVGALVRQYLKANYDISEIELSRIVNGLITSTATPIYDAENNQYYSVRRQGAGLANAGKAISSGVYIDAEGTDKAKIELGDDPDMSGVYELCFTLHNIGSIARTYSVNTLVMGEVAVGAAYHNGIETYITIDRLKELGCSINAPETVTVGAGDTTNVSITVTLSEAAKSYIEERFSYGSYVEGFVFLNSTDGGIDLSIPFLGFYGDWERSPMFEAGSYDTLLAGEYSYYTADTQHNTIHTSKPYYFIDCDELPSTVENVYLGRTTRSGRLHGATYMMLPEHMQNEYDSAAFSLYLQARNGISPNNDGSYDTPYLSLGLLRNAENVRYTVTDMDTGEVYWEQDTGYVGKNCSGLFLGYYDASALSLEWLYPLITETYDWGYSYSYYDTSTCLLPNNTQVLIRAEAWLEGTTDNSNNANATVEFPVYIDTKAPVDHIEISAKEDWTNVEMGWATDPMITYYFKTYGDEYWYTDWDLSVFATDFGNISFGTAYSALIPGRATEPLLIGAIGTSGFDSYVYIASDFAGNITSCSVVHEELGASFNMPETITIEEGENFSIVPAQYSDLLDFKFMWRVSNDNIECFADTASESAEFFAANAGTAVITASIGMVRWNIHVNILLDGILPGDVNGDNVVDLYDALALLRYTLGVCDLSPDQLAASDVNYDGMIDASDALCILRSVKAG